MNVLKDPRYTTIYASDYKGAAKYEPGVFYLPPTINEKWCKPGYQPVREDKGYKLTVNDYPFHPIYHGGSKWPEVVHTPYQTDN